MTKSKKTNSKGTASASKGEYRNLELVAGLWVFEVKVKAGWQRLTGLTGETSKADAEKFAQNTADGWRKR